VNYTAQKHKEKDNEKLMPIILSALMLTSCADTSNNKTNTYRQISMDEAVKMMAEETGYIILDVRRPDEFAAGHIPKAINVPNETIGTADIPELPNKNQLIMVYCRSGRRSKEASEKLVKLGYTNIVEFGGILDWQGEIVIN
jgi:rhodanese-related sulfurtransferase